MTKQKSVDHEIRFFLPTCTKKTWLKVYWPSMFFITSIQITIFVCHVPGLLPSGWWNPPWFDPFFSWSNRIICVWLATWVWQSHKQTMSKAFLRSGYIRNTSSFCDWLYRLDQKARKSDLRYNPPFQQPTGHQATPLFRSLRRLAKWFMEQKIGVRVYRVVADCQP